MLPSIISKRRASLSTLYRIGSSTTRRAASHRAVSSEILDSVARKDFVSALQQFRQSKPPSELRLASDQQRLTQSFFDLLSYLVRMVSRDASLVKPLFSDKLSELAQEFGNEPSLSQSRMTELMAEFEQLPAMADDALIVLAEELYAIIIAGSEHSPKEGTLASQAANQMLRLYAMTVREVKMNDVYLEMRSHSIPRTSATFQNMLLLYSKKKPSELLAIAPVTRLIWEDMRALAAQDPMLYCVMLSYYQLQGREAYSDAFLLLRNELKPHKLHENLTSGEWAWMLYMHPQFWIDSRKMMPLDSGPIQYALID